MGIFNMFIVIPQILAALGGINWINGVLFAGDIASTMLVAGLSCGLGAVSLLLVDRKVQ
jgi:maltose/moltooligosaccharide transporter